MTGVSAVGATRAERPPEARREEPDRSRPASPASDRPATDRTPAGDRTPEAPRVSPATRTGARIQVAQLDRDTRARIDRTPAGPGTRGLEGPRYAHDARMSEAERARLPRDQAAAVARAQRSYGSLINRGYQVVVTESSGNQRRPVVVIKPPNLDPAKKIDVHTHYHGDGGSAFGDGNRATRQTEAIEAVTRANPQSVFVLPSAGPGQHGAQWRGVNQATTTRDAITGLNQAARARDPSTPELTAGTRTVSFHSAAHEALRSSASQPGGLAADRVELLDNLTAGSTAALIRWKQGEGKDATISIHEGSPAGLQSGEGAVARERRLVEALVNAGAVLATRGEDHFELVYRNLQGNVPRQR